MESIHEKSLSIENTNELRVLCCIPIEIIPEAKLTYREYAEHRVFCCIPLESIHEIDRK